MCGYKGSINVERFFEPSQEGEDMNASERRARERQKVWGNGNGPKRRRPISQAAAGMEGHTDRRKKDDGGVDAAIDDYMIGWGDRGPPKKAGCSVASTRYKVSKPPRTCFKSVGSCLQYQISAGELPETQ